jgi:hypothetical protein
VTRVLAQNGFTALHFTAGMGDLERCTLLLAHGASVSAREEKNWTPLHVAARAGHAAVVALLLGRGASAAACTVHGETPLALCEDEATQQLLRPRPQATRQLLLAAAVSSAASATAGALAPAGAAPPAEHVPDADAVHFTELSYEELSAATGAFDKRPVSAGGRLLGDGADGEVYAAHLRGRNVAVKRIKALVNAKAAQAEVCVRYLRHANVVPIWGVLDTPDFTCLVLPLMECSLHDALYGPTLLTAPKRLRIARDIAAGLAALHAVRPAAIIHRDLKPANVLLESCVQGSGWHARIADFGHARTLVVDERSHASTAVTGTPGFVCPEYYETDRARTASDVYSLGFILLLLTTGQLIDDLAVEVPPLLDARTGNYKMRRTALKSVVEGPLFHLGPAAVPSVCAVAAAAGVAWTEQQVAQLWRLCIACLQPAAHARPSALVVYAALQVMLPPDVPAPLMDFAAGIAEEDHGGA